MGNPFIPFPRCENIIIVGDAAAEYLGALRIYGRGLIGGDVPVSYTHLTLPTKLEV